MKKLYILYVSDINAEDLVEFANWSTASNNSNGYSDPNLIQVLAEQFEASSSSNQFDGLSFDFSTRRCHLILGYLLSIRNNNHPRIADYGGGSGYMYRWIRQLGLTERIDYSVFESKEVAKAYQRLNPSLEINFFPADDFTLSEHFDLTIVSCTLQYIEEWEDVLLNSLKKSRYVLLLRTPLIDSPLDKIYIQTPRGDLYESAKSSWPIRFFSRFAFMKILEDNSQVLFSAKDFEENISFHGKMFPLESFLCRSKFFK